MPSELAGVAPPRPRISVVVVTYNYGRYLPRALDSIHSQDGDDFEVLVIDDGSTDQTREVVRRYTPKVRYIRQAHAGAFAACRTGYRESRGRWIMFVDADDRLTDGAMASLRAAADLHADAWMILGRYACIFEDGRRIVESPAMLDADPMVNFARLARGQLRPSIAGGLIDRSLVATFAREPFDYPHGTDLALLGHGLLHPCVQIDSQTLEVFAHPGRLRDDISSIHRSGLTLVDMLFDPAVVPPAAMRHRKSFISFLELERTRAYYHAGWHSQAWRSYARAVAASPRALFSTRNLRRATVSFCCACVRRPHNDRAEFARDPVGFLERCAGHHSPVTMLRLRHTTFLLSEPTDAMYVLVTNAGGYRKAGILRDDPLLAGGMIGADQPVQAQQRRILQPMLRKQSVQAFAPVIAGVVDRHVADWSGQEYIELTQELKGLCVDIAGRVILGCDDPDRLSELVELLRQAHQLSIRELRASVRWPGWVPLKRRRLYAQVRQKLNDWLSPLVESRCKNTGPTGPDSLSALIQSHAAAGPPKPAALRDCILMPFLAAYEPVSVTLAWGLQLLAEHPTIQDQVAAEAQSVIGSGPPNTFNPSDLNYTAMVVGETLRMYPNEWLLTRRSLRDDQLPCGQRVRRGQEVMISPYLLARDSRFFPEPEKFDPQRFAGPPTWPSGAYIPFGAGPRNCMGEFFARLELTLAIAMIVARFHIEPLPGDRPRMESPNCLSNQPPEGRLTLRITPRSDSHPQCPQLATLHGKQR